VPVDNGAAVLFRPGFSFSSESATPNGLPVTRPETAAAFDAGFVFRLAFQNGSYIDISTEDFPGLLSFIPAEESGHDPEITTVPEVVVVDGYVQVQGGDLLWGDDEGHAGFALLGDYLVMYDGVPDGTAEAAFAVLKTSTGGGNNNDGGGSGGGCATGAGLFALIALPLAVVSAKRKDRCGK
jgi:hypothetical protein